VTLCKPEIALAGSPRTDLQHTSAGPPMPDRRRPPVAPEPLPPTPSNRNMPAEDCTEPVTRE